MEPGAQLGPYIIQSRLGAGGMGEVYLARDPRLGREVAIKTSKGQFSERFEREARAVAALNHPNICTIYDVGAAPDVPGYIVMEVVEGPTLQDRLKDGPINVDEALAIARQIGEALEAAHDKGIVHRDLKPANIKLLPDGRVKVLDFGLAKIAEPISASSGSSSEASPTITMQHATEAGMILGTAAYMSPEQARGKNVDKRTDIWAFGVVLYEMLSADRAFGGETVSDILAAVLTREIDLNKVPERVRPLLRACLERDHKKRLRDIGDAWRLLDAAPASVQVIAAPPKKTALLWPIAAGVAALAAAVLAFIHFGEPAPETPAPSRFRIPLPANTTFPNRGAMAMSPDGKHLLFPVVGGDSKRGLWIHSFDTLEPHPVAGLVVQQAITVAWRPDSKAFLVVDSQNRLQKFDIETSSMETVTTFQGDYLGAAWTSDDTLLFGTAKGIVKMPASGGDPQPLTQMKEGEQFHLYPTMLPDGRNFLYVRYTGAPESTTLAIGSLDKAPAEQSTKVLLGSIMAPVIAPGPQLLYLKGEALVAQDIDVDAEALTGEPRELAPQVTIFNNAFPMAAVSQNGRLVYRAGSTSFLLMPTWYSRTGENKGTVGEGVYTGVLVLSPDASQAALTLPEDNNSQNRDLWILNTSTGSKSRFTFDEGKENQPVWSRDGKRIAFRGDKNGGAILIKNVDGSGGEELVLESKAAANLTDWSKDGRYLIFHRMSDAGTGWDEWVVPLEGDRQPIAVAQSKANEQGARFSPDGRYIAYISNETGRNEIYVQELKLDGSGAGKWMVSQGAVGMPRWRADGRELIYLAADSRIMAVDVTLAPVFRAGQPHQLFQLPPSLLRTRPDAGAISDMTPDAQRFLFSIPEGGGADVFTVVENWDQRSGK